MRRAHRSMHRRLMVILALLSTVIVFMAHRARSQRPVPAPVDLTSTADGRS